MNMRYPAIPREKLPWYPTIDYKHCLKDLDCMNFCPHDVFEWDPVSRRPIVAHPNNCVPGCNACAEHCRMKAITLPTAGEMRSALRRLRRKLGLPIGGT
jgi:NAD-dependent dihydropyrimidine dehydrogenase PreA subunit